jgi:hypothetical protein
MLKNSAHQSLTGAAVRELASEARNQLRLTKGGFRREHVRAFAQHVEVANDAIYIKGSKKHPVADAGSHQRREISGNRRSRLYPEVAEREQPASNILWAKGSFR